MEPNVGLLRDLSWNQESDELPGASGFPIFEHYIIFQVITYASHFIWHKNLNFMGSSFWWEAMLENKKKADDDCSNSDPFRAQSDIWRHVGLRTTLLKVKMFFDTIGTPFIFCDLLKRMSYISHASDGFRNTSFQHLCLNIVSHIWH